ncbi:MAG: hypothetical protein ACD_73C00593G0005 [uncultured bacterium]|nr:MAG: hypothetical protein ACD_73C00593G0005 [uncultured bacterium]
MKFKYRLTLLQKMAREKERQEKIELGRLIQERSGVTIRLQALSEKMTYWYQQYNVHSWNPTEVGLIENHLAFIDKQKRELLSVLRELEEKIKAKRLEVSEAYKTKRKYEIHEEYQKKTYMEEVASIENRETADMIQVQYFRKHHSEVRT